MRLVDRSLAEMRGKDMSHVMRKPKFHKCKNKGKDQLHANCAAGQHLCFCYIDRTIPLLSKSEISSLQWLYSPVCVGPVQTPKTGFLMTRPICLSISHTHRILFFFATPFGAKAIINSVWPKKYCASMSIIWLLFFISKTQARYSVKPHITFPELVNSMKCGKPVFWSLPTQTRLYNHRSWLEAWNFGLRKKRDCTVYVVKTKALISCAVILWYCSNMHTYGRSTFCHSRALKLGL